MRSLCLIVARHAESGHNLENRIQGHLDSPLTPRGKRQAESLARRLAKLRIKKIYSSDLGRAMSTTLYISERLKQPILPDSRLREVRLGRWEGLTPDEVNARFRNGYKKWRRSPSRMQIPGGENIAAFRRRVVGAVDRIRRSEKEGPILIMTHGGVIAALLCEWLLADFDKVLLNLKIDNTSLTFVECRSGRMILHDINDTDHLAKRDKPSEFNVFSQPH